MTSPLSTRPGDHVTSTDALVDDIRSLIECGDFVTLLGRSWELASEARGSDDHEQLTHSLGRLMSDGPISAIVAIESLAQITHDDADRLLIDSLTHPEVVVRNHAAWRLADRRPNMRAVPTLLDHLAAGGISTMHAHRTLRRWASVPGVAQRTISALSATASPARRARIVDLLGVIGGEADEIVLRIALDDREAKSVRAAAIGALGLRSSATVGAELLRLAAFDDSVATEAALALVPRLQSRPDPVEDRLAGESGLRIAQLVLTGGLDGQLSLGGRGDTGGVASLLVSLGEALAQRHDIAHVLTIGRGTATDAVIGTLPAGDESSSFEILAFGDDDRPAPTADLAWEHVPAVERGLRRALEAASPLDVLHLRMADAGTLVGAEVAAELGIPICFSVAPDPHNVIESMQSRGVLDPASFLRLEAETHVWFRARLIERIARDADQLALFPRSRPIDFLEQTDGSAGPQRRAVVAEGIDIRLVDRARDASVDRTAARVGDDVLDELAALIPPSRRGLPLAISVGRLHPVKGMDRVVSAWVDHPGLSSTCNLVIVGGDLDAPSAAEASVIDAIDQVVGPNDPLREGLVLLGGRPRADVARLMIAAVTGHSPSWDGGGVYVDGALKEEFGLAVLEAMASGLVVVAPSTGGPSTYVEDGITGLLVEPDADLGAAMLRAFDLVGRTGRVERARAMVEERFSIDTMAAHLVELYRPKVAVR